MKNRPIISFLALVALLLLGPSLHAQVVSGSLLNIGPSGSNLFQDPWGWYPSEASNAGAIGMDNMVGDRSLAVGEQNLILVENSLTNGYGNFVAANNSFAAGYYNETAAENTAMIGHYNFITYQGVAPLGENSLIVGDSNLNTSSPNSLVAGSNNSAFGSGSGATLGQGLINNWSFSTIVGSYNDETVTEPLRFAVGTGTDSEDRRNAFEIYADGKILMAPQGDISMGTFAP